MSGVFRIWPVVLVLCSCTPLDHLGQNLTAGWTTLVRRLGLTASPVALVDLSACEVARILPETACVQGVYFSDFVEQDHSNHIRPAARYRHTADTLLGDKRMPLSHFSRFYGVEGGMIKAGRLGLFADSTIVLPVRNRDCGYISRIEIYRHPGSRGWLYVRNPFAALKYHLPLVTYYPPDTGVAVFGRDGNRMAEPTVEAARNGKIFLADSLGHAVFINNLPGFDPALLEQLNALLEAHPMGPVLIDNGRYFRFRLTRGSYRDYVRQDLYRPDSCLFVVGSLQQFAAKI